METEGLDEIVPVGSSDVRLVSWPCLLPMAPSGAECAPTEWVNARCQYAARAGAVSDVDAWLLDLGRGPTLGLDPSSQRWP